MKAVFTYMRRLNMPGQAPGVQAWALAVILGLLLGSAYQVDAIAAQLPTAAASALQLVTTAPTWVYYLAGFVVVALLVIVPTLRAIRCGPLDPDVWTESELQTLHQAEAQQEHRNVFNLAERRATDRRAH